MTGASGPEGSATVSLYPPVDDDGWHASQVRDWIGVCPELSDSAIRLYLILRALVIEKRGPVRKLTLWELCYLLPAKPVEPGVDPKPSSVSRIRGLLRQLTAIGLITTPDGRPLTTSSRALASGRGMSMRINLMPRTSYTGPRNVFDVLDAVRAAAEAAAVKARRKELDKAAQKRADREAFPAGQISDPQVSEPGVGQISDPVGQISDPVGQISDPHSGADQQDHNPPLVSSAHSLRSAVAPVPPSLPVADACAMDGRTDGGGVIEVQEQGAVQAGELETAAAVAAPELRSNGAGVAGRSSVAVAPVMMTPGVTVLRAIAAEAPEWKIVHAKTLEDQGATVTEMLAVGFTPQEIRHAIVSVPLPQPVRTTIGAVIGGRLANLRAAGPSAGILLIPAQHTGYDDVYGVRTEDTVHIPPSWREQQARLDADVAGQGRHRLCAGDDGMCGQLAVAGADLCGVCLGGEQPTCQSGCGRGVVAPGALCLVCRDAPSDVPEVSDTCPGLNEHCGRPLQTMGTTGLCGRCTMKAEQIKMDAEAAWQTSVATAVEAASAPAPF